MERYESLGLVGEGSYGTVLKCRHRDTGRLVAIKKFMDSDSDKTVRKIATREIKLLRKLSHDNLVNLLEVWKRRRRWYLVFEFVDRTLLDDLEKHPSGLDLNTTRQYLYQILRAAAFCHEQNIIHRDIKPENVLVSQGGVVKLCDFGLARTMASPAEAGVYTDYVATRWYRAPELLVGDVRYGRPVDVWAVGCLFVEMLTGQPLFPGDSDLDQIYLIMKCLGSLTAHHQELFLRNPMFSGVRLPECSVRVPLQDRCPTITPTDLDLAQSCLQMDPEGRAQCSQLLEHPLFTLDCFHIRFLDELNAKIQKDHRENSTLPKIIKTPRQDKDDGNGRKHKGRSKKHAGAVDEKLLKGKEKKDWKEEEKLEKTKAKLPANLPKTIQYKCDSLVSKQSKASGINLINPGKAAGSEPRQEPGMCTIASDSSQGGETGRDYNQVSAKDVSPSQHDIKMTESTEDAHCTSLCFPKEPGGSRSSANTLGRTFAPSTTAEPPGGSPAPRVRPLSDNDVSAEGGAHVVEHQSVSETQEASDTAGTEGLAQLTAAPVANLSVCGCLTNEQKNNETESQSLLSEPQGNSGCFINHSKSTTTVAPKPQRCLLHTEATVSPEARARTRGLVLHNVDTTALNEFVRGSCGSPPLLPPPPSTPLMVPSASSPASDHPALGTGFHPVSLSLRYGDKPRHHGGFYSRPGRPALTTPITAAQASDKNLSGEQSDQYVHSSGSAMAKTLDLFFPDVQSLGLPELRGRDGKNYKVIAKDQKRSRNPAPHRHDSADTYTQKH